LGCAGHVFHELRETGGAIASFRSTSDIRQGRPVSLFATNGRRRRRTSGRTTAGRFLRSRRSIRPTIPIVTVCRYVGRLTHFGCAALDRRGRSRWRPVAEFSTRWAAGTDPNEHPVSAGLRPSPGCDTLFRRRFKPHLPVQCAPEPGRRRWGDTGSS
jgi:hypothetical protein